jgi:glutathione S-transferase
MSYPLLRLTRDHALVVVRKGRGAQRWEEMSEIFHGAAEKGKEWKGGEGDKLSAKLCRWPSDPNSALGLAWTQSSREGLGTGRPEILRFPSGLMALDGPELAAGPRLTLHEDPRSGNCYKIRLAAALLGLPLARVTYDIMHGETRTPQFLAEVNVNGRIPVLQVGERFLPESNAACWYLADGSGLIPGDGFERADMLRWMFFEQYNHEPNIATLRFWLYYWGRGQSQRSPARADPR